MNYNMIETSAPKLLNYTYRAVANDVDQHHTFIHCSQFDEFMGFSGKFRN